jgi:hypothetical protein
MLGQVGDVDMWALEIGRRKGIDECTRLCSWCQ